MILTYKDIQKCQYAYVNIPTNSENIESKILEQLILSFELNKKPTPASINIIDIVHTNSSVTHNGYSNKFLIVYQIEEN